MEMVYSTRVSLQLIFMSLQCVQMSNVKASGAKQTFVTMYPDLKIVPL